MRSLSPDVGRTQRTSRIDGQHFYGQDPRRPDEVATLKRMRELRESGLSYYAVVKALDAQGLKPRNEGHAGPSPVVKKILTRVLPV